MREASVPTTGCSTCNGGPCPTAQACHAPLPEPVRIERRRSVRLLPTTREGWGRLIGALLGLGGFVLFAHGAAQHLHLLN